MEIREATVDDAAGIARVHIDTWRAAYRGIVPDEVLDGMDIVDRTTRWRGGLAEPDGPTWVALDEATVIGWANAGPTRDDDMPGAGELYGIYVDAAYWGTEAGPALMDHGLEWLRERYEVWTLWTLEANARARRFYERCGWTPDGTTKVEDRGVFKLREVRYRMTR